MPFARWESFDACVAEQQDIGHSDESSHKICGAIQARAEKGALYKAQEPHLDIIQKSDDELVVGGYASWEIRDPQRDVITTQAQVNFLKKFFSLPEAYRNIMWKHGNIQAGVAILEYQQPTGEFKYSHVNERGTYLISLIRNEDWRSIQKIRQDIISGKLHMYSIAGDPIQYETKLEKGEAVRYHYDIDPWEVTLCERGVNPKAEIQVLSKAKGLCTPCFEKWYNYYLQKDYAPANAELMAAKVVIRIFQKPKTQPKSIHRAPTGDTSQYEDIFQKHWSKLNK